MVFGMVSKVIKSVRKARIEAAEEKLATSLTEAAWAEYRKVALNKK